MADGAGDYQCCSRAFRDAARRHSCHVQVVTFEWSHGYMRSVADLVDKGHARAQGQRLARVVQDFRREHPGKPVHIVGHSAGAMVVMAALESLPEGAVDRAVLISPSLSVDYDVRPALAAVRLGLHNFHSDRDWVYCGLFTRVLGTSDRRWNACCGRLGFRACGRTDPSLAKLVQRAWTPADAHTGNEGGHFGNYDERFLGQHVLPLFCVTPRSIVRHGPE